MSSKMQDEKHLKILRELQKRADNKFCFNCRTRGPQFIVLDYGTFVCTACSGIHRESDFNNRIKGVSMASFTPEEVKRIEAGGNQVAEGIWLARWSESDGPKPDSSDPKRVRQFMKKVFVDRKYYSSDGHSSAPSDDHHSSHQSSHSRYEDEQPTKVSPRGAPIPQRTTAPSRQPVVSHQPPPQQQQQGSLLDFDTPAPQTAQKSSAGGSGNFFDDFDSTPTPQQQQQAFPQGDGGFGKPDAKSLINDLYAASGVSSQPQGGFGGQQGGFGGQQGGFGGFPSFGAPTPQVQDPRMAQVAMLQQQIATLMQQHGMMGQQAQANPGLMQNPQFVQQVQMISQQGMQLQQQLGMLQMQIQQQPFQPQSSGFGSMPTPGGFGSMPTPGSHPTSQPPKSNDPFGAMMSPTPSQPSQPQQPSKPDPFGDLMGSPMKPTGTSKPAQQQQQQHNDPFGMMAPSKPAQQSHQPASNPFDLL